MLNCRFKFKDGEFVSFAFFFILARNNCFWVNFGVFELELDEVLDGVEGLKLLWPRKWSPLVETFKKFGRSVWPIYIFLLEIKVI